MLLADPSRDAAAQRDQADDCEVAERRAGRQQAAEPEQGVIEEARRRRRRRRLRASLTVLAVALAAAAGAILASSGHSTAVEAPLHLAPEPSPLPPHHTGSAPGSVVVRLSPNIEGSQAGWCVLVVSRAGGEGGSCGPLPTRAHPLLGGGSGWELGEPNVTTTVVTAPQVAYVLVNGRRRVATVAAGLPYGLRAAAVHTPLPPRHQRLLRLSIPKLTALNASGQRIVESPDYGDGLPFRDWNRPGAQAQGVCQLHAAGVRGLTAEWGQVAIAIHPYPGQIVGRGFVSCLDTEYYVPGRGMRAALLLDAANPGRSAPAAIPGLAPIPQVPGMYNGSGDYSFHGPITAKRAGNAWIVVAGGGKGAEEARIRLLRHLTASFP